jgi:capsular exopolysaccharide synthesis family protein
VIVVAAGFFASMRKEPQYVAECRVLFQAVAYDLTNPNATPFNSVGSLESHQGVITSPEIALPAAQRLKLPLGGVLNQVNVEIVPGTQIFRLRVVDAGAPHPFTDPLHPDFNKEKPEGPRPDWSKNPATRSQDICNTVAAEYIEFVRRDAELAFVAGLQGKEGSLAARLEEYRRIQGQLDRAENKSEAFQLEVRRDMLLMRISDLQGEISGLQEQLEDGIDGGGKIITSAGPGALQGADHKRDLSMGLIIGLIFGIGIALVREYLDDTVKDKETTQRELGLPVLAAIPGGDDIDGLDEPSPGTIEAARNLRATLASLGFPHEKNMLVVTSSLAKRRATTLASLAAAVAESGRSVLVIGSDMRSGRTHEAFGIHNSVGLANVVRGQVAFEKAIRPAPGLEGVYVMPAGPIIGNPGELLSSEAMAITLARARRWADVVLLDAPPVLQAADSSILGAYADGVLLVVSAGQTNRAQANEAKEQLIAAGARVLGVVLVGATETSRTNDLQDDLDLGGYGDWGGYGYEAGSYEPGDAAGMEDPWFDESTVSINAYAEERPMRARRPQPQKKTAASAPGQRPARARPQGLPRNGVRTANGRRVAGRPASTTAARGGSTARAPKSATRPARKTATRSGATTSKKTATKPARTASGRTGAKKPAVKRPAAKRPAARRTSR